MGETKCVCVWLSDTETHHNAAIEIFTKATSYQNNSPNDNYRSISFKFFLYVYSICNGHYYLIRVALFHVVFVDMIWCDVQLRVEMFIDCFWISDSSSFLVFSFFFRWCYSNYTYMWTHYSQCFDNQIHNNGWPHNRHDSNR